MQKNVEQLLQILKAGVYYSTREPEKKKPLSVVAWQEHTSISTRNLECVIVFICDLKSWYLYPGGKSGVAYHWRMRIIRCILQQLKLWYHYEILKEKKNPRAVLFLGVYLCTSWLEMQKQGGGVGGFGFGVTHKMAEQMYWAWA